MANSDLLSGILLLALGAAVYFLPAIIAAIRDRESTNMITVLNLLLGWTVLVWIILLVVSFTGQSQAERAQKEEELDLLRKIAQGKSQD